MDKQKIVEKLLSGRFILTVLCGLTFTYLSCKGKLEPATVTLIIGLVFRDYFERKDRPPTEINGQGKPVEPEVKP